MLLHNRRSVCVQQRHQPLFSLAEGKIFFAMKEIGYGEEQEKGLVRGPSLTPMMNIECFYLIEKLLLEAHASKILTQSKSRTVAN